MQTLGDRMSRNGLLGRWSAFWDIPDGATACALGGARVFAVRCRALPNVNRLFCTWAGSSLHGPSVPYVGVAADSGNSRLVQMTPQSNECCWMI